MAVDYVKPQNDAIEVGRRVWRTEIISGAGRPPGNVSYAAVRCAPSVMHSLADPAVLHVFIDQSPVDDFTLCGIHRELGILTGSAGR
jgi:hypothetical protein